MTGFTGAAALTITVTPAYTSKLASTLAAALTATATTAETGWGGPHTGAALTITLTATETDTQHFHRNTGAALTITQTSANTSAAGTGAALTAAATAHETDVQHRSSSGAALIITFNALEQDTITGAVITPASSPRAPTIRYPAGPITPAGGYHILADRLPMVTYRSYDDKVVFNLMGGLAIADPTMPERVELCDIKGLVPPWQNIEQKGATQDGSTYVTSLYDSLEVDLTVMARGRDPAHTRQVIRDWIASWDAKQPGTLSWFTHQLGYWWAPIQWAKNPVNPMAPIQENRQKFVWAGKAYSAFWRSYDTTAVFAYSYLSAADIFNYTSTPDNDSDDLGSNWIVAYNGLGSGSIFADGTEANSTLAGGAAAVAQRAGFVTASDEQIVTITIGPIDPWPAATNTYLDLWARMANTGTPGQTGVRLRIGYQQTTDTSTGKGGSGAKGGGSSSSGNPWLRLSYFVAGVETILAEETVTVPWQPTDQISLAVGGFGGHVYSYYVQRGTNTTGGTTNVTWQVLLTYVNSASTGDGSMVGPNFRGAGFGMEADGATTPATIVSWTAGDSTAAEESGYLTLFNAGDQDMWPYFILVGPGLFGIGDGPNATQAVTYGPLEQNQIVVIQTDPRKYAVTDLTSLPPPGTPAANQFISSLVAALADYNSFLSEGAPAPNLSVFGTPFPQGNPYSLLEGRFSRPIPAKLPGSPPQPQPIAVAVESGGPTTAILAGGTPLRRYPQ